MVYFLCATLQHITIKTRPKALDKICALQMHSPGVSTSTDKYHAECINIRYQSGSSHHGLLVPNYHTPSQTLDCILEMTFSANA